MPKADNVSPVPFEISPRVARQARAHHVKSDGRGPRHRPLRIYTLDPSVSARLGGVATVMVPYEKLAVGPVGALFDIRCDGAPASLRAEALDLEAAGDGDNSVIGEGVGRGRDDDEEALLGPLEVFD